MVNCCDAVTPGIGGRANPGGLAVRLIVYGSLPLVKLNMKVAHWSGHKVAFPDSIPTGGETVLITIVKSSGHGPGVVYFTEYELPPTALEMTPVDGLIVAPSPGGGSKENVPPGVLIPDAGKEVGAQKSAIVKEGSCVGLTVTVTSLDFVQLLSSVVVKV